MSINSFKTRKTLKVGNREYDYFSLPEAQAQGLGAVDKLPMSMKVLLENLLRFEDNVTVSAADIRATANWAVSPPDDQEIAYRPARVLMQDFTGVPAVADLAAMRGAVVAAGKNPAIINPLSPVDLVIDHSVMVDKSGSPSAFEENVAIEMARNTERYRFLRWGQQAFDNFRVVPPGTGICHQVNLEYLARVVWTKDEGGRTVAYPDTLVGTDSHTTMINGIGVLGWGVGGIEAEAAMLGQPVSMLIPEVIGFKLTGRTPEGITATDLVLRVVEMLRKKGVVGKFVEFYGDGLNYLSLADRATIANMAPEYGATCGFFPVDDETINYMKLSSRPAETVALVEAYAKAQGMWRDDSVVPTFTDTLELDLATIVPSLAGPKRPQDRVVMAEMKKAFDNVLDLDGKGDSKDARVPVPGTDYTLGHGDVVIAAITSCTNTSNPAVMLAAGLVAQKAVARGLNVKPWVKTSLAPGSKVVTEYLEKTGLQSDLDRIGFNLVGYGCTTCIGNSGPLPEAISAAISAGDLVVSSVLSGNRNFEGRVHQEVRTNWLASPPLVVAFALAGTTRIDLGTAPIGKGKDGKDVFLKDIWPSNKEVADAVAAVSADMFDRQYGDVFTGPAAWQAIDVKQSGTYGWENSTYIKQPPFFSTEGQLEQSAEVSGARILALLGDSVTTDHISPAGEIQPDSPAGHYLQQNGVQVADFNSYGSRRGNHEVMMRGTFANIRIKNEMVPGVEGGYTRHIPSGEQLSIYDASMRYQGQGTPLVVIAGKEYGTGSSRDWAAKGTRLLGVNAVIAESFERIHRSNLIGMGILPLQFKDGDSRKSLGLTGDEIVDIRLGAAETTLRPRQDMVVTFAGAGGSKEVTVMSRIDTDNEIEYFKCGGILQYVLNNLVANAG
ncbi:MAG: aconitate hydratase AcnA [Pseudomonadales bacterium]|nr:aconitate hydratase AcnA [Pseudomonadales bacterium]MCP5183105.1 aconitate hydratase AcnA [Pseudomonadales bacterium]